MTRSNTSHRSKSGHGNNSPPSYDSVMLKDEVSMTDEVNAMLNTIELDRNVGSENNKNRAILAVLSNGEAAESLTKRLRPSSWASLKVWSKPKQQEESCRVEVTTRKRLSKTIGKLDLDEDIESMLMLVSRKVRSISFDLCGENITDLQILRCGGAKGGNATINGASTFGGTRLDQWQVNSERFLYIGEHGLQVHVQDPSAIPGWADAHRSPAATGILDQVGELKTQLENTKDTSSKSWMEWWDKWKGPAAAAVGIATATTKFAFDLKGAVGGVAVRYTVQTKLLTSTTEFAAFGAKLSSVVTAAGPAVLLGVASAAAVYFVPWETFFSWLGDAITSIFTAFSGLWEWFLGWWEGFKEWMDAAFNLSKLRQHAAKAQNARHGHRRSRQRH